MIFHILPNARLKQTFRPGMIFVFIFFYIFILCLQPRWFVLVTENIIRKLIFISLFVLKTSHFCRCFVLNGSWIFSVISQERH